MLTFQKHKLDHHSYDDEYPITEHVFSIEIQISPHPPAQRTRNLIVAWNIRRGPRSVTLMTLYDGQEGSTQKPLYTLVQTREVRKVVSLNSVKTMFILQIRTGYMSLNLLLTDRLCFVQSLQNAKTPTVHKNAEDLHLFRLETAGFHCAQKLGSRVLVWNLSGMSGLFRKVSKLIQCKYD